MQAVEAGRQALSVDGDLDEATVLGEGRGADLGALGILSVTETLSAEPVVVACSEPLSPCSPAGAGAPVHTGGVVPGTSVGSSLFEHAVKPSAAIATNGSRHARTCYGRIARPSNRSFEVVEICG